MVADTEPKEVTVGEAGPGIQGVQIVGNANAPFIYFDFVSARFVDGSVAILEVIANSLVAVGTTQVRQELITTAHLRCSLDGLRSLKTAVDALMLAIAKPEGPAN